MRHPTEIAFSKTSALVGAGLFVASNCYSNNFIHLMIWIFIEFSCYRFFLFLNFIFSLRKNYIPLHL